MTRSSTAKLLLGIAIAGLAGYAAMARGPAAVASLKQIFARDARVASAPAAPQAVAALKPLARQIAECRPKEAAFQACMFDAGYAVNAAWKAAHDAGRFGAAGAERAHDVVVDRYRSDVSPAYGVPYWVPKR